MSFSISNHIIKRVILSLAGGMIVCIPLYVVQQFLTQGSYFNLLNQEESSHYWFPENLFMTDTFIVKSFCYIDSGRLATWLHISPGVIRFFMWILSFMVAVLVILYATRQTGRLKILYKLSLLISLLTLGLLVGLSLFNSPENWSGELWTYVKESRYYLPVMLLFHMWFAKIIVDVKSNIITGMMVRVIGILFLLYATLHMGYRYYEYFSGKNMRFGPRSVYASELRWMENYFESQAQKGHSVVFVHGDLSYAHVDDYHLLATLQGFGIMSLESFMMHSQQHSSELIILITFSSSEKKEYQRFRDQKSLLPSLKNNLVRGFSKMELYQVKLSLR